MPEQYEPVKVSNYYGFACLYRFLWLGRVVVLA
jgi:hypothetical protein